MSVPNTFASATSAIPLANLDADFAYYDAAFQIAAGAMEVNYIFRLEDPTDVTKKAEFVMSGITTGTTRQYTMPNVTGALASLGNISQTFTGSTSIIPTTNGSAITIGGIPSTGTITLGRSTASQTIDIAVGATTAASTKTVNIGTTGVSTSTTNINYGSSVTGALVTQTWNAGANSMRFDSSGNLGIGTTSPGTKLEVAGAAPTIKITANNATQAALQLTQAGVGNWLKYFRVSDNAFVEQFGGTDLLLLSTAGNLGLGVTPSAWGSSYKALDVNTYGSFGGGTDFTYMSGNLYQNGSVWKYKTTNSGLVYYQADGQHQWFNTPSGTAGATATLTQAMTLTAAGNLLVGQTGTGLQNGTGTAIQAATTIFNHVNGQASGTSYAIFGYNATSIGSITQSGTTAVLYNVTSDQRLKENIVDAPEFGSVIDSIKVRSYDWKTDQTHQRAGFIAQELVTVAPEAVHQPADPEDMMAVDYSKLVPMLVKELQSLRARVASLESK